MRAAAIILLVLCLAAAGLTGYLYFNANVIVTEVSCVAADAADQAEMFAQLKAAAGNGTFTGTPFDTEEIGSAEDYLFYTYTVRVNNGSFVDAEVAEIQVTPMSGDVLQTGESAPRKIPARSEGTIQTTILTRKGSHNVREMTVTWYLWGLPFSAKAAYTAK